jgi:hypothetical protein
MTGMKSWMLGAAVLAGGLALGTSPAQAAEFGIAIRGPVAYVPPCPGPGYVWAAGYQASGYWVPGRWNYGGRERFDRDRGWDRDRGRDWGRDHDRRGDRDRFRR